MADFDAPKDDPASAKQGLRQYELCSLVISPVCDKCLANGTKRKRTAMLRGKPGSEQSASGTHLAHKTVLKALIVLSFSKICIDRGASVSTQSRTRRFAAITFPTRSFYGNLPLHGNLKPGRHFGADVSLKGALTVNSNSRRCYSALKACIGSSREARHAGTRHASAAEAISKPATEAKTSRSSGRVS